MKKIALHLSRFTLVSILLLLILSAVAVTAVRTALPMVNTLRSEVEQQLSDALQTRVELGELSGKVHNLNPAIHVDGLVIYQQDHPDKTSLIINELVLELDTLSSITSWQPVFRRILLRGSELKLEGKPGSVGLAGFSSPELPPSSSGDKFSPGLRQVMDTLSQQRQIDFQDVEFTIAMPSGKANLVNVHRIQFIGPPSARRMTARIQTSADNIIDLTLNVTGKSYNWPDVMMNGYVFLPETNLKPWLPLFTDKLKESVGLNINQFRGGAQLWFSYKPSGWDVRGHLKADMLDIDWQKKTLPPLTALEADFWLKVGKGKPTEFWLNDLSFLFSGFTYPSSNIYVKRSKNPERSLLVTADSVHLQPLSLIAHSTGLLPPLVDKVVTTLAPRGRLNNLAMRFYPKRQPFDFEVAADFREVSVDHWQGAPSGGRLTGSFRMNRDAGIIDVDSQGFILGLDNVFDDVWSFDRVNGQLYWHIVNNAFVLRTDQLHLRGGEGDLVTRLRLDIPFNDKPIWLALEVGMTQGDVAYTGKYLPVKDAITNDLADWLNGAIKSGDIKQGAFILNGALDGDDEENDMNWGLFFDIDKANIAFSPDWPELTDMTGQVIVDTSDVIVEVPYAMVLNSQATNVYARIPDLLENGPLVLSLTGQVASNGHDGLRVLTESPISAGLDHALDKWKIDGDIGVGLNLKIPLESDTKVKEDIKVAVSLNDNNLYINQAYLDVSRLNGNIYYSSAKGLYSKGLKGQLLGFPADASISSGFLAKKAKSGPSMETRIDVEGKAIVKDLEDWLALGIPKDISGQTDYRATVKVGTKTIIDVNSNLAGIRSTLPAPLNKPQSVKKPLHLRVTAEGKKPLRVSTKLGRDLAEQVELNGDGDVIRRGVNFGSGQPVLPEKGILVTGELDVLAVKPWLDWWTSFNASGAGEKSGEAEKQTPKNISLESLKSVDIAVNNFSIGRLFWEKKSEAPLSSKVVVDVRRLSDSWKVSARTKDVGGTVMIPDGDTLLEVVLDEVRLPADVLPNHQVKGATETQEQKPEKPSVSEKEKKQPKDILSDLNPALVPDMNVDIKAILIDEKPFGHLAFNLRALPHGLEILSMKGVLGGGQILGHMSWHQEDGGNETSLNARILSTDIENFLMQWGHPELMAGKSLDATAYLRWPGSPAAFEVESIRGDLELIFKNGRFLSVDSASGALRLFGVLNLDSITRRLRLDFSDLYSSGMAFDRVKGKMNFNSGVITFIDPVEVKGPSSDFVVGGSLNIPQQQLNMDLIVTLPVTQNISVVSLLLGQPYIAGAAYLFDKILGSTLEKFASLRYEIKGSFSEPEVKLDKLFSNKVKDTSSNNKK